MSNLYLKFYFFMSGFLKHIIHIFEYIGFQTFFSIFIVSLVSLTIINNYSYRSNYRGKGSNQAINYHFQIRKYYIPHYYHSCSNDLLIVNYIIHLPFAT